MADPEVEQLKQRVQELERQVERLRKPLHLVAPADEPPPVLPGHLRAPQSPPGAAQEPVYQPHRTPAPAQAHPPQTVPLPPSGQDTEFTIGAKLLPRVGAGVFILGIVYLVGLGISRGWITPTVQFVGALALCALFIGAGFWRMRDREEFGQVLVGVGSCGLYAVFASGHAYHGFYNAETLIAFFIGLSLLNLAYALWRSSKTFLAIGLVGGLIASWFPYQREMATTSYALTFLILIPSILVAARNRWSLYTLIIWIASLFVLALGTAFWVTPSVQIAAAYLHMAICCAGYALGFASSRLDSKGCGLVAMVWAGCLLAFAARVDWVATAHVAVAGSLCWAVAVSLRGDSLFKPPLLAAAVGAVGILAPMGLMPTHASFAFLGLALLSAWFGGTRKQIVASQVGVVQFLCAFFAFTLQHSASRPIQVVQLLLLIGVTICLGWSATRATQKPEAFFVASTIVATPFWIRLLMMALEHTPLSGEEAVIYGLFVTSGVLLTIAKAKQWVGAWASAIVTYLITLSLTFAVLASGTVLFSEPPILIGLILLAIYAATTSDSERLNQENIITFSLLVSSALWIRLSLITLLPTGVHVNNAWGLACLSLVFILGLVTIWKKWQGSCVLTWVALLGAGISLANGVLAYGRLPGETEMHSAVIAASVLAYIATTMVDTNHAGARLLTLIFLFPVISRLGGVIVMARGGDLSTGVSAAWIAYAIFLLALGFLKDWKEVRYASFAMFGASVAKVILYDLATVDPLIRVAILMALGGAMLAGGWWYVRRKVVSSG